MKDAKDESQPRSLTIKLVDEGDSYLVTADRNRIEATDEDVCDMIRLLRETVDELHAQVHVARDLAERIN